MKFDKFIDLIIEAPINNLELRGDWNDGKKHGWDKPSRRILQSPKGIERMRRLWSKTHQTFDIYLLKGPKVHNYLEIGEVQPSFIKDKLKLDLTINPDNITVIYTNNKGAELMPATPWTLAHRFAHAVARKDGMWGKNDQYIELFNTVKDLYNDVAEMVYRLDLKQMGKNTGYGNSDGSRTKNLNRIKKELGHALGTFKSARDHNLRNENEFTNEIVAQYLITGGVKLNRQFPEILATRYNWGTPSGYKKKALSDEDVRELDDVIGSHERTLELNAEWLIDGAVNRVYVM